MILFGFGAECSRTWYSAKISGPWQPIELPFGDGGMDWSLDAQRIASQSALGGIYVVRTSLSPEAIGLDAEVAAHKGLALVAHAFRTMKESRGVGSG